jgi:hypothetical protein
LVVLASGSGRADENREASAKAKEAKTGKSLSTESVGTTILSDEDYVHEISEHAFTKQEPVRESDWERYRTICKELAKRFDEASKTRQASDRTRVAELSRQVAQPRHR